MSAEHAELARRFIAAVERGATRDELSTFLSDDVEQHELPNRLFPEGARRDLAAILASAEKGANVLSRQRYEILGIVAEGAMVAVEMRWQGTLAIPLGKLAEGDALTAHLAFFLEIADGKIRRMRNYDCYDAF
ncbi:MAG: nuclear transport factor 2 family protein [Deltaproteobacteria bacterium]|nr:nuclear transport factor 2 family protein [Deltaproteobacteria bacterium]